MHGTRHRGGRLIAYRHAAIADWPRSFTRAMTDSKGLNEQERKALELPEERSKLAVPW